MSILRVVLQSGRHPVAYSSWLHTPSFAQTVNQFILWIPNRNYQKFFDWQLSLGIYWYFLYFLPPILVFLFSVAWKCIHVLSEVMKLSQKPLLLIQSDSEVFDRCLSAHLCVARWGVMGPTFTDYFQYQSLTWRSPSTSWHTPSIMSSVKLISVCSIDFPLYHNHFNTSLSKWILGLYSSTINEVFSKFRQNVTWFHISISGETNNSGLRNRRLCFRFNHLFVIE